MPGFFYCNKEGDYQLNQIVLANNLQRVSEQVSKYSGHLLAVTKFVDKDVTRALFELGVREMAENRPEPFLKKLEELSDIKDQITWHFIGHLQTRQVKKVIHNIDYLHSLDRVSLAKEIQKRAICPLKCFLQVNVSGEASKGGFQPDQVLDVINNLVNYDKIIIVGLMTMAPIDATDSELHHYFKELRLLQEKIESLELKQAPCHELSMGMSRDYLIALEEGASYVRIGTALYKE